MCVCMCVCTCMYCICVYVRVYARVCVHLRDLHVSRANKGHNVKNSTMAVYLPMLIGRLPRDASMSIG